MSIVPILYRNIKWRFHHKITILITILQPMLWLLLYSTVAGSAMRGAGIENYTAFVLPGLMVLVSFGCCSSSGIMNYLMKQDGSFYRVLTAPIKRSAIVLGQILEAVLCTFLEVGVLLLTSLFFSVRIATDPCFLMILPIIFLTAFFVSGLSCAVSLTLPNEVVYETVMNAVVLPVFFLSSALFPTGTLAGGLAFAVNLNPFTHVVDVLRDLILHGEIIWINYLGVIGLLAILCAASFSWALIRLTKETKR